MRQATAETPEKSTRGWRGASIRARATVGATVVFVAALVAGSFVFVSILQGTLVDGVHRSAEQHLESLLADDDMVLSLDQIGAIDDDVLVQVQDEAGVVIANNDEDSAARLPTDDGSRVRRDDEDWLLASDDVELGDDREGTIVVGASLEEAREATTTVTWLLVGGVPLIAIIMGGVTWFVIGRALRPVERMRREVDAIEATNLDRRLEQPPADDEIGRLAGTMNRMLTRLDRSQRAQRQFVSDASHELRSPLAVIRQHAELARSHPEVTSAEELSDIVLAEGARLQDLVESLLLLARLDERGADHDLAVDLDDLALAEVARVRAAGTVTIDGSKIGPGQVLGDERLLHRVIRNLVDNAVRHASGTIALGVVSAGGRVTVTVDDDGSGIAEADRLRVFERFVRLDEARARDGGGSGLGLAIVEATVRVHRGSVTVSDSPSGGTRFTVDLPAAP
ncbi:ATP-binding protein [soil metagenome]